jgi:hypothetical protein
MTARTRITLLLLVAIGLAVAVASPSSAHSASEFYPRRWASMPARYDYTSSVPSSWRPVVDNGANQWSKVKRADFDFARGNDVGNYDWSICTGKSGIHVAGSGSGLGSSGGVLAVTVVCWPQGSSWLSSANVAFDSAENWYVGTGSPSSSQIDLFSVATHELGHAAGFSGHFAGTDICPNNSDMQTLCAAYTRGTTWPRSLEKHDKHTLRDAY